MIFKKLANFSLEKFKKCLMNYSVLRRNVVLRRFLLHEESLKKLRKFHFSIFLEFLDFYIFKCHLRLTLDLTLKMLKIF